MVMQDGEFQVNFSGKYSTLHNLEKRVLEPD